ncbi:MAG: efflux transporter outer membrane subunit [Deltaproteobacteria bacterium]|nr:efflux transporter outer membrane subunit [Deltaproteobacteria bacterium]
MQSLRQFTCLAIALLGLCACAAVGPDYKKPEIVDITPADWHWKLAEPRDTVPGGEWWTVFGDPVLDQLESAAVAANQDLRAAVARVDAARSAARISRSRFFPEISLDPMAKWERTSGNLPTPIPFQIPMGYVNTFSVPFDMSYEVDLWGRVRRSFEAAQAQAQASISDYRNVLLTLNADVAVNYFLVRALDMETDVLEKSIQSREQTIRILNGRFQTGTISEIDVVQARRELAVTRADLADTRRRRTETFNALSLLCGKPASDFELVEGTVPALPPDVPVGLPSTLLERRPDIARAERTLAARNAQIGVARAAYFPALHLTGQTGYLSADAGKLFTDSTRVWSISPSLSLPLFTAGRTTAEVGQAEAVFQESLAAYRQAVLTAFREVEDSLAQIVLRSEETSAQAEALSAARQSTQLAKARYETGTVNYLEFLDADRIRLQQERRMAQLAGQRFVATVRLIKALGGGWEGGMESE